MNKKSTHQQTCLDMWDEFWKANYFVAVQGIRIVFVKLLANHLLLSLQLMSIYEVWILIFRKRTQILEVNSYWNALKVGFSYRTFDDTKHKPRMNQIMIVLKSKLKKNNLCTADSYNCQLLGSNLVTLRTTNSITEWLWEGRSSRWNVLQEAVRVDTCHCGQQSTLKSTSLSYI